MRVCRQGGGPWRAPIEAGRVNPHSLHQAASGILDPERCPRAGRPAPGGPAADRGATNRRDFHLRQRHRRKLALKSTRIDRTGANPPDPSPCPDAGRQPRVAASEAETRPPATIGREGASDDPLCAAASARPRTLRASRPRNRLLVPAPVARRHRAEAPGGRLARAHDRARLRARPRAGRRGTRGRALGAGGVRRPPARGARRDAQDPGVRRADADRAAAEEDVVLHAEPGRGGDRRRPRAGARSGRHVLPHLPAAGAAASPAAIRWWR